MGIINNDNPTVEEIIKDCEGYKTSNCCGGTITEESPFCSICKEHASTLCVDCVLNDKCCGGTITEESPFCSICKEHASTLCVDCVLNDKCSKAILIS